MTVDDFHKQSVLYISRGQLKKHTSTFVNFSLNVRYISQQVNMPLLRLLNQISNMYQNVKETQMELKQQQPESKRNNLLGSNLTPKDNSSSKKNCYTSFTKLKIQQIQIYNSQIFSSFRSARANNLKEDRRAVVKSEFRPTKNHLAISEHPIATAKFRSKTSKHRKKCKGLHQPERGCHNSKFRSESERIRVGKV